MVQSPAFFVTPRVDVRALTKFFAGVGVSRSCVLGCVCRAWNDDDVGVYQGARPSVSTRVTIPF